MGEECRHCKKWKEHCRKFEEHFYWDHVDVKKMHFSKFMTGDFSSCMKREGARRALVKKGGLSFWCKYILDVHRGPRGGCTKTFEVLPKKFIDNFKGELLETIELKVPSGDKWHVELKKTCDGVVLDCGWTNFVAAHGILENDTLVFKYDGRSSFLVLMFEQSGCEKAASHCAMRKDGMEELCAIASGKKDRYHCYESSPRTYEQPKRLAVFQKILRANRDAKEKHVKRRMNTPSSKRILRQKKHFTGARGNKSLNEQESEIIEGTMNPNNEISLAKQCNPKDFIISKKARLTDAEKNIVLRLAETIQTDRPTFVSIMVPSCVSKRFYLTIPIAFAIQYLPRASVRVLLQLTGKERTWPVRCLVQGHSVGFSSGWKEFAQYNQLNVGDVCFFEMLEAQEGVLMAVHINRIE